MINRILGITGCLCLMAVVLASSQAGGPIGTQPCVAVEFALHTYTGPVVIDDACLSAPATYDGTTLRIEAVDAGDGIFRNGFEG